MVVLYVVIIYLTVGVAHVLYFIRTGDIEEKDGAIAFALFLLWPLFQGFELVCTGWPWLVKTLAKKKEHQQLKPPPEGDWRNHINY